MSNFQNQANISMGLGKVGTISRRNPLTHLSFLAEGNNIVSGSFVKRGTNPEGQAKALEAGDTADLILGVAVFEKYQVNLSGQNTLIINEGEEMTVVLKGYVYIQASTASSVGDNVIVNPTTGEIRTLVLTYTTTANLTSGAVTTTNNAPAGFIDTGFK
ncbi:MAG: DUF2190 family protein [Elusimicrobiota bacterium]|jgi:hypothetical protein|nr:DUF2190 family protein [Elusimicrobiota bacterium]